MFVLEMVHVQLQTDVYVMLERMAQLVEITYATAYLAMLHPSAQDMVRVCLLIRAHASQVMLDPCANLPSVLVWTAAMQVSVMDKVSVRYLTFVYAIVLIQVLNVPILYATAETSQIL
jgi:hypothetical protein